MPVDLLAVGPLPNSRACDGVTVDFTHCRFHRGFLDLEYWAEPVNLAQFSYSSIVAAVAIGAVSNNGRNMLAIAADTQSVEKDAPPEPNWYDFQSKVQCEVVFHPRTFRIDVDAIQRLLNVTDSGPANEKLIDPTAGNGTFPVGQGILAQLVMSQIMEISRTLTSLYSSVVGEGEC